MAPLTVGDPAPWFILPSTSNPNYHFDAVGGYRVVLFFFGSSRHGNSAVVLKEFCAKQSQFAALGMPFFGVSIDPEDTELAEVIESPTYCKFLWDFDRDVSSRYGVCQIVDDAIVYAPTTFVLDERLHVFGVFRSKILTIMLSKSFRFSRTYLLLNRIIWQYLKLPFC